MTLLNCGAISYPRQLPDSAPLISRLQIELLLDLSLSLALQAARRNISMLLLNFLDPAGFQAHGRRQASSPYVQRAREANCWILRSNATLVLSDDIMAKEAKKNRVVVFMVRKCWQMRSSKNRSQMSTTGWVSLIPLEFLRLRNLNAQYLREVSFWRRAQRRNMK